MRARAGGGGGGGAWVRVRGFDGRARAPPRGARAGQFYTGDSYIVLATIKKADARVAYNIHFWLGEGTSQDEMGAIVSRSHDTARRRALPRYVVCVCVTGRWCRCCRVQDRGTGQHARRQPRAVPRDAGARAGGSLAASTRGSRTWSRTCTRRGECMLLSKACACGWVVVACACSRACVGWWVSWCEHWICDLAC